jgi:transcriptional regulator with XRE-family HTH domain
MLQYVVVVRYMNDMPRPINTATRLGQLRNLLNIGIEEFAELSGLSTHMIRSIESGREGKKNCPTTLDLKKGEQILYTRDHYNHRTQKNLDGPLHPFLNDIYLARCQKLLAFLRTAERQGKAQAGLYLFNRFIDEGVKKLESFPSEQKRFHQIIKDEFQKECEAEARRKRKQKWFEERALTGPRNSIPAASLNPTQTKKA